MRGGISMVSRRYAKANNPRVKGHNPDKPIMYIQHVDANNLYGCMGDVTTSTHGRIRVGGFTEHTNDTRSSRQNRQGIHTRSRCRVPIKLTPQTQRLSASARSNVWRFPKNECRTTNDTYFRVHFMGKNRMK